MERTHTSRRDLLEYGVAAIVASACGGCSLSGSRQPDAVAQQTEGALRLSEQDSETLLKSEGSLLTKGANDKILVVHRSDGGLFAVSAGCTHMGCDVNFDKDLGRLVCPCHGSEFDLEGQNLKGPAKRPLKRYTVRTENSQVVIEL